MLLPLLLLLLLLLLYLLYNLRSYFLSRTTSGIPPRKKHPIRSYTSSQVKSHNKASDLWLIIKGKVYDFTSYVELHPGGEAMLRRAGLDSTEGFSGEQHPHRVWDMLDDFYVGDLRESHDNDNKKFD